MGTLATLDAAIEDAKENHGESEVREALLKKAEHLAQIGDKEATIEAVRQTNEKTVGLGNRMDLVFLNIRVGLFFTDHAVINSVLALDRSELHKEVIKGSEILEVLHQLPDAKNYLFSLYNCQYAEFFQELGKVEQ